MINLEINNILLFALQKTLGLLDIYPSLIEETTMDGLWEFFAPFISKVDRDAEILEPRSTSRTR